MTSKPCRNPRCGTRHYRDGPYCPECLDAALRLTVRAEPMRESAAVLANEDQGRAKRLAREYRASRHDERQGRRR